MEQRIIVSGGNGIGVFRARDMHPLARIGLNGAGALCPAADGALYGCGEGDVIFRLSAAELAPVSLFAGGPGLCSLLLSDDGQRLYALCADTDSVLMLDARTGTPQVLCRAGVNPRSMALDESGGLLAVAGGEAGETLLFDAQTLEKTAAVPMPGPVYAVSFYAGSLCSLCLTAALDAVLVICTPGGAGRRIPLRGMPGALLCAGGRLFASVYGALYVTDGERVLQALPAPGRARRLAAAQTGLLIVDELSETLYLLRGGRFTRICAPAVDVAVM